MRLVIPLLCVGALKTNDPSQTPHNADYEPDRVHWTVAAEHADQVFSLAVTFVTMLGWFEACRRGHGGPVRLPTMAAIGGMTQPTARAATRIGIGAGTKKPNACVRCPMLHVNPKMLPHLDELENDLQQRRKRAAEGWAGEIEGIDLTLAFLRDKRAEAHRVEQREPIHLGLPAVGPWNGS